MADSTGIQWTDATWNPVTGCSRVSPGCVNCYAERMSARLQAMGQANYRNGFRVTLHPEVLEQPLAWRRPRRIFVCSMADLFHPDVPDEFIESVFGIAALAQHHTFQVLTKRPERAQAWFEERFLGGETRADQVARAASHLGARLDRRGITWDSRGSERSNYTGPPDLDVSNRRPWPGWPLPNVWVGTSVESRRYLDRLDTLRRIPAALRFVSFEPLLEPVQPNLEGIDWAIIGGESGPGARRLDLDGVRHLLHLCRNSGTVPFVKQLGRVWARLHYPRNLHGAEPSTWPEDLRVQEFPVAAPPRPTLQLVGGPA